MTNNTINTKDRLDIMCNFFFPYGKICILVHCVASYLLQTHADKSHTRAYYTYNMFEVNLVPRNLLLTTKWPNVTKVHVVILNPYYSPSSLSAAVCWAAVKKWTLTMAWSQCTVVLMSTCHEMCMNVCMLVQGRQCVSVSRVPACLRRF